MWKGLAILMIPLLIFASGGLNIFSHSCHSHHEEAYSLMSSPECNHEHSSSCCNGHIDNCETHFGEASCCISNHIYVKTVEWNFSESPLDLDKMVFEISDLIFTRLEIPQTCDIIIDRYKYADYSSPPDYSPKYITVLQQKLRLDC